MAMLAEPRRKQKWSVDPRNSAWTNDESKFGQKMLEKMGWSKGKGLGAKEQGSTEHIKVQVKNNTMGLGACNNYEDKWIAHQDDFNQLLAELNDCHGTASSDSPANDSKKSFSLEEKSKTSKKRVHYMKFAKGKDLSCRSDTDLACIFGKREKRKKSGQDEADADAEKNDAESEEKEQESPSPKDELGNTVTSSLSVTQYFAQRMAELKKSQSRRTEAVQQSAEASPADGLDDSTEPKKKHKKKKPGRNDGDYENGSKLVERNDEEDPVHERKKPKSKKNRCEITDGAEEQEEPEQAQEDELKRKKGKNKRNREALDQIVKKEDTTFPIEDASTEEPKKKKKKKKKQKSHD